MTRLPDDIQADNRTLVAEFRAAGGARAGRALLLLTAGRRPHRRAPHHPTEYVPDGDRLFAATAERYPVDDRRR